MNVKPRPVTTILLLSTFLLAWASTAVARDIVVEFVPANLSTLNVSTTDPFDTILIRNGGSLLVDVDATIASLTIGDSASPGTVSFPASVTLTVKGNVNLGADSGNVLDMSVSLTTPQLQVGGSFLASGAGTFRAGSGTIEYNGTAAQSVTANIGGSGVTIQYKHLTLSGNPSAADARAAKNFAPGVSVQGFLTIKQKAVLSGPSVTYGTLAQLYYNGSVAQTSTTTEWPAVVNVPVTINNSLGLTLDGDKTIGAAFPNSLTLGGGTTLNDNGKTLTVQGSISNAGQIKGSGKLVLGGSAIQNLLGLGNYGNVTVNNAAGAVLPGSNPTTQPTIAGRLTIQNGKVGLPAGTAHQASLLTFGGADKPAGSYDSGNSPTAFAGAGTLTVPAKPAAVVVATNTAPNIEISYGDTSWTLGGTVKPPTTAPNFADYGNGALNTEQVTVTLLSGTTPIKIVNASLNNGTFLAVVPTDGLAKGTYTINIAYPGGINLAGSTLNNALAPGLVVKAREITVVPQNASKTFGTPDPALSYTYSPALLGSDSFSGSLSRQVGENVGDYLINQGSLNLDPLKYTIIMDLTKKLHIAPKPITITVDNKTKTYGQSDPAFTFTASPALIGNDQFTGSLTRDKANTVEGELVGTYAIKIGTLTAGPNYALALTSANLTINKLAVSIAFTSKTKGYGDADPAIEWTTTPPLVGNDAWNSTLSGDKQGKPARASGETVPNSPYTYLPGTLSILQSNNYTWTFTTSGALTINKRDVTVTAQTKSKTYGDAVSPPNDLVTYAGFWAKDQSPVKVPEQTFPATTLPTVVAVSPSTALVGQCSVPGPYTFAVTGAGTDPNYNMKLGATLNGTITVTPKVMHVVADNKTKVGNNTPFDKSGFTVTYVNFVCDDTTANSFSGTLDYEGPALTATDPGVYAVTPKGLTSTKYSLLFDTGYLSITTGPATNSTANNVTWDGGGSQTWFFSHAGGQPGKDPGWTLLKTSAQLIINATENNKFTVDLVTVAGNANARMQKFDPTRPYMWRIVEAAGGIANFDANAFTVKYDSGGSLFLNPVFNGTFSVGVDPNEAAPKKALYVLYAPMGAPGNAPPNGYSVGSISDPSTLLGDVASHDIDALYLQPNTTSITPQQTVTINLNVANLKQPIIGVETYINFDSRFFVADAAGKPGAPQVQAGGGVWDTVIYRTWNVGGDLDTVIAVNLNNSAGTSDNGTVGKITLTPTKTATGKSRVVFRQDGGARIDGGALVTSLQPVDPLAVAVLPARVMTDEITIVVDDVKPVIDTAGITATQVQPHVANPVNVKNGTATSGQVVRTSGSGATGSGKVIIMIPASDAGVGLSGPPVLVLANGSASVTLACTTPNATVGPFEYDWSVPGDAANGSWSAQITATDTISPAFGGPNTRVVDNAFNLYVNTMEVTGVVELQQFKGTNRTVTFKAGDGVNGGTVKSWDVNLNFISGTVLGAGAFQDRAGMDKRVETPSAQDTVSTYLRYGDILDLPGLAGALRAPENNLSLWIDMLLYGNITDLPAMAAKLKAAATSVDVYILGSLSSETLAALAAYVPPPKESGAEALTVGLLTDFTTIVVGPNIYEPVRFASVTLSTRSQQLITKSHTQDGLTGAETIELNRNLLHDTYSPYSFGVLDANTAERLTNYGGGADATLQAGLLAAFDTITTTSSVWPPQPQGSTFAPSLYQEQVFLGIPLSDDTLSMINDNKVGSPLPSDQVILLNQKLLEDAYRGMFERAPLTPATVAVINAFNPGTATAADFDAAMQADLNALINSGSSIYTAARFAGYYIDPNSELGKLLALPNPTAAQLVRENRLLLELAYDTEMSKSVLATYRLVAIPTGTTEISAKTAWSLRVRFGGLSFTPTTSMSLNFVNEGTPLFQNTDRYLRGGDITGDNVVNLSDYNVLRLNYGTTAGGVADMNGDGVVNILDYSLLRVNWQKAGDADVQ